MYNSLNGFASIPTPYIIKRLADDHNAVSIGCNYNVRRFAKNRVPWWGKGPLIVPTIAIPIL
jgi:hypothetical protein